MLAALRKLHAWSGLALCLVLATLALSGASLVFKPQWLRLTVPGAARQVTVDPAAAAAAMTAAEATFPQVKSVTFAGAGLGLHQVYLADGGGYLAPDGRLVQAWGMNERVVDWLFDLHHHLLSGDTGQAVTGIAGLAAILMVLTGVVLWTPVRRSFAWRLAPRGGRGRAGWLSAHRDLGIVAAPLLMVTLLTGAPVALSSTTASVLRFEAARPPAVAAASPDWPAALAAAQARFPNATLRSAAPPAASGRPIVVRLRQPGEWHVNGRTVVYLDPGSSRVVAAEDAFAHPLRQRLYNALWPVHASRVGGLFWQLATFLGGLALAALSLYGAESYRQRLLRTRPVRVSAADA